MQEANGRSGKVWVANASGYKDELARSRNTDLTAVGVL